MNSLEASVSMCRICLQTGARHPIFDKTNPDIQDKLRKCLPEKLEDAEGYPRNICTNCKITLETVCEFIETYNRSSKLLRESLSIVKIENDSDFGNDYSEELTSPSTCDINNQFRITIVKDLASDTNKDQILKNWKPEPGLKISKVCSKDNLKGSNRNLRKLRKKSSTIKKSTYECISKTKSLKTRAKIKAKKNSLPKNEETVVEIEVNLENYKKTLEEKLLQAKQDNSVLCNYCGTIFDNKQRLSTHIKAQHLIVKITCKECSKEFASEKLRGQHHKRCHSEKTLQCEYCTRMFSDIGTRNTHVKSVHKKHLQPKQLFTCKFCNKVYKAREACYAHERSVHTGLKPYICSVCDKSFAIPQYLRQHMMLHTGETPYKCPICERGYSQLCNMKSHLKQHKRSELNEKIMSKMRPSFMKCLKNC